METSILSVQQISKSFPGVMALDKVDLDVARGEVVAVIGENGAGKSTLMKIVAGIQPHDQGKILVDGMAVKFARVNDALAHGIVLIHQELNLAENLDVGGNIFLGREPTRLGFINRDAIRDSAITELRKVGLNISPDEPVANLSIGHQQLVEIAKALSVGARLLIMDEPTSSLSKREVESLFRVVDDLRSRGVSVIYISHRLDEIRRLADRVVVLRDGQNAGVLQREQIDRETMVNMMIGREVSRFYSRDNPSVGKVVLKATDLVTPDFPEHRLNFMVRRGEIVGIAGLVGAGRTELLLTLFGINKAENGHIEVDGSRVQFRSPRDAINAGIVLVPEDRKQQGLTLEMNVLENLGMPGLGKHQRPAAFINRQQMVENASKTVVELKIKTPDMLQISRNLSGGNQQKIVIGKWLALQPKIFLLDEPTRGIDVGAKQEVYRLIGQMAQKGVAVIFVSSEMEEIVGVSDRVLVMHEGRISGQLERDQISEQAIMRLATGS